MWDPRVFIRKERTAGAAEFSQGGIGRRGPRLGEVGLAEEPLSLKTSSQLEKPGCGLHSLLAVSCTGERQAELQLSSAFPPEHRAKEVSGGGMAREGVDRGSLPPSGYPSEFSSGASQLQILQPEGGKKG